MAEQKTVPLWRYIELEQFSKPKEPTKETIRKGVFGFLRKLRRTPAGSPPVMSLSDLNIVPNIY